MISQINGGTIVFECDHCGDALDTKTRDPEKAVMIFTEEAWRVFTFPKDMAAPRLDEHYCASCPNQKAIMR